VAVRYLQRVNKSIASVICAIIVLMLCNQHAFSQEATDTSQCPVKDISDIIRGNKAAKKEKPPKNYFILITPVIGSSPATGFILGAAGQLTFKGNNPDDKYSLINANAQYTTKNQALFQVKNNLLLAHNKLFATGDYRIFIYSQPTFGLGTDVLNKEEKGGIIIGNEAVDPDSIAQEMKYNYFKFYQTVAYNFKGIFYFGGGVAVDIYEHIQDLDLDLAAGDTTFHYSYSVLHQYDTSHYTVMGASANAIIDTRDNQINATKGLFLNLSFTVNPKFSSSQHFNTKVFGEFRYFKTYKLMKRSNTIGFWVFGTFVTGGTAPYLTLPAVGWDQRSRSGRGYAQGTFRGQSLVYGEFEYRFPISCNGFLGGVFFVNATTASDKDRDLHLFRHIQPAFGVGLRLNMDKASRTNLVLDYAIAKKSNGFYLNAGETF
jgi:hypothetical protein